MAYQFAARVAELEPEDATAWTNLGMLEDGLYRFPQAERCFQKAVAFSKNDKEKGAAFLNWTCMLVNSGDWEAAEKMGRRAYKYRPESPKAQANLGLALLAMRQYREGWPLYDSVIGFDNSRRRNQYKDEQPWDGSKGKRIVVYGEQGLGDEIKFASMLPDAIRDSAHVTIDCTDRLVGLFQRSFPQAKVHGTRWDNKLRWDAGPLDASISVGGLGKFYRNEIEDFPRKPYLVPDPDRVEMWRGLFAKQGKPVIGVAWSGGVPWTAERYRRWSLEELAPVFQAIDATYISLEYKDASKEIATFKAVRPSVDLRQYPFGTLTDDYDDTAAMVAALDLVFAMQTSVVHLAGALGKPTMCFVNKHGQAHYGVPPRTAMDWYGDGVHLYRQDKSGAWPLEQAAADLKATFS